MRVGCQGIASKESAIAILFWRFVGSNFTRYTIGRAAKSKKALSCTAGNNARSSVYVERRTIAGLCQQFYPTDAGEIALRIAAKTPLNTTNSPIAMHAMPMVNSPPRFTPGSKQLTLGSSGL